MNKKQLIIFIVSGAVAFVILVLQIVTLVMLSDIKSTQGEPDKQPQQQQQSTQPQQTQAQQDNQHQDNQHQDNQQQDNQQQDNQQQDQQTQAQQDNQQPIATQSATVESGNFSAVVTAVGESWDSRGKKATRVNMVVTNNGDQPVTGWTVTIDVPAGSEIENGWNGEFKLEGTKLTVTGTDGRTLNKGDSYPDAGFIIISDAPFTPN